MLSPPTAFSNFASALFNVSEVEIGNVSEIDFVYPVRDVTLSEAWFVGVLASDKRVSFPFTI